MVVDNSGVHGTVAAVPRRQIVSEPLAHQAEAMHPAYPATNAKTSVKTAKTFLKNPSMVHVSKISEGNLLLKSRLFFKWLKITIHRPTKPLPEAG